MKSQDIETRHNWESLGIPETLWTGDETLCDLTFIIEGIPSSYEVGVLE